MDRESIIEFIQQWIARQQGEGSVREGLLLGSVWHEHGFTPRSDLDIVLLTDTPAPLAADKLAALQFKLGHTLDVISYHRAQLESFSPCHRHANLLMTIARTHPTSQLAQGLTQPAFFADDFQIFWEWFSCLRRTEVYLRHPPLHGEHEQRRRQAAWALLVERRGFRQLGPHERLDDFLPPDEHWWRDSATLARTALRRVERYLAPLLRSAVAISPPREEWLVREFWDERERLGDVRTLAALAQYLGEKARELELKVNEVRP